MSAIISPPMATPAPAPAPPPERLTVEEFAVRYAGQRVELIDGVVKEIPMPGVEHGVIVQNLAAPLWLHVRKAGIGRIASNDSWVPVATEKARGGDVLYFSYERLPKDQPLPKGTHPQAPEMVGEVKSPSDRWGDLFIKVGEYLKAGVLVILIVDPVTRTVSVYREGPRQHIFEEADTLIIPDILPGFSIPVAEILT